MAVRLGVDPRQADQNVRGTVVLPHGTGKTVRVARLRQGRQGEREAEEAGADFVGGEDLVKKIQDESWLDFDNGDRDARHDGRWSAASERSSVRAA